MVTRRSAAAAVAATLMVLLATTPGGAAPVAVPAAQPDGVAVVIARYQARIPELMAREHIPGLAVALSTATGWADHDVPARLHRPQRLRAPPRAAHHAAHAAPPHRGLHPRGSPRQQLRAGARRFRRACPQHLRHLAAVPGRHRLRLLQPGIDLAGYILEQTSNKPFPVAMRNALLAPLGMHRSTFDRSQVRAATNRAVGHSDDIVPPSVDVPIMAAGGLWASAADLARFLRFQLGNGTVHGRTVLDAALMREMRTVPAPNAGAPAGYALGVARTRWPAGQYLDLFGHGGGGFGFLSDLWWLPQLQLGIAVLTNSDHHDLQETLALGILQDLVTRSDSRYHDRLFGLPTQYEVHGPAGDFVVPRDLPDRIAAVAMPASSEQSARWAGYPALYRTGQPGAMDPRKPPSRFYVESGVPYFDAAEDGTPVRHRLTEFQPGLFVADNGETLDLRGPSPRWRGLDLNPVANGPLPGHWALLAVVVVVAAGWFLAGTTGSVRRRRDGGRRLTGGAPPSARTGRHLTSAVAAAGALTALVTGTAIRAMPGLVDVGFLGWAALPLPVRLAFHLPLVVALLAAGLAALLVVGALRHWWTWRIRPRDVALAVALIALSAQLASWHLVAWGF